MESLLRISFLYFPLFMLLNPVSHLSCLYIVVDGLVYHQWVVMVPAGASVYLVQAVEYAKY